MRKRARAPSLGNGCSAHRYISGECRGWRARFSEQRLANGVRRTAHAREDTAHSRSPPRQSQHLACNESDCVECLQCPASRLIIDGVHTESDRSRIGKRELRSPLRASTMDFTPPVRVGWLAGALHSSDAWGARARSPLPPRCLPRRQPLRPRRRQLLSRISRHRIPGRTISRTNFRPRSGRLNPLCRLNPCRRACRELPCPIATNSS